MHHLCCGILVGVACLAPISDITLICNLIYNKFVKFVTTVLS
jgi:hypothetical protein